MHAWQGILWGTGGAIAFEASDFVLAIRRRGSLSGTPPFPLIVATLLRLAIAAFIAAAFATAGQVNSAPAAVAIGMAAPQVLTRLGNAASLYSRPPAQRPSKESGLSEDGLDAYLKEGERELRQGRPSDLRSGGH